MTAKAKTPDRKPMMAVALLAILIIGYFTRDQWMSLFTSKVTSGNGSSSTSNTTNTSTGIKKDVVLKKGDRNDSVKELQRLLNVEHVSRSLNIMTKPTLPKLVVDGDFGPKTEALLMYFTNKNSISINQLTTLLLAQKSN